MILKRETSRDIEGGEDKPSSNELNNVEVSAVAEELASLALSSKDCDANSDSDEVATQSDPELLKPHPPNEDCPVCFFPRPFKENTYFGCCDKVICSACASEHFRATNIVNIKRKAKELPKLAKPNCPFCRGCPSQRREIELLEERVQKGNGAAAYELARHYLEGNLGLDQDEVKAVELYHRAADMGSARADLWLSHAYASGEDLVKLDFNKAKMYAERAVKQNYPQARTVLALLAITPKETNKQIQVALQHYMFGAKAGCKKHMDRVWKFFYGGDISKEDLEDTLRKYHQSCENMNSEARERYAAWEKAKGENDQNLIGIYTSYYHGLITAKQLKMILAIVKEESVPSKITEKIAEILHKNHKLM